MQLFVFLLCVLASSFTEGIFLPLMYPMDMSDIAQEFLSPLHIYYCGNEWSIRNTTSFMKSHFPPLRRAQPRFVYSSFYPLGNKLK